MIDHKVKLQFKKIFHLFFQVLLLLLFFIYLNLSLINKRAGFIGDQQLTTIVNKVEYSPNQNFKKILKQEKRILTFKANDNNLGIVSILFNNFKKKNSDRIFFKIKEENSQIWFYQKLYKTNKINESYFYTFGFPIIKDSKDKNYIVEIESKEGLIENSISFHERDSFFLIKYSYPKSYLLEHKNEIIPFVKKKTLSLLEYISKKDIFHNLQKTFLVGLGLLFFNIYLKNKLKKIFKKKHSLFDKRKIELKGYLRKYTSSFTFKTELFILLTPVVLLLNSAFFSPITRGIEFNIIILLTLVILNIFYSFIFFKNLSTFLKKISEFRNYFVLIPVSIFVFLRSLFLDVFPRWDSTVYFYSLLGSVSKFDFSFQSFMNFNWHAHPTMGFGLYSAIFQFINPGSILLLHIGNIVLGSIAIFSFYFLIKYFFNKIEQLELLLVTSLFALNPLFFSITTAFQPDIGMVTFFVISITAFLYQYHLLALLFLSLLVFSKETGVFIYTILIFSYAFFIILKNIKTVSVKRLFNLLISILPGVFFFFFLLYQKGSIWTGGGSFILNSKCMFCLSIQPQHMLQNLGVIFSLNFSWILTFIIIFSFIKKIFIKTKTRVIDDFVKNIEFKIIQGMFWGFISFFMIYVVFVIPRYMVVSVPFLIIFFYFSLRSLFTNVFIRKVILLIIIFLYTIQIFYNIDLLSNRLFGNFNLSNYTMTKVDNTEFDCDGMVYNTQYVYIDRLINKFNKEYKIKKTDNIIVDSSRWDFFYTGSNEYPVYFKNNSLERTISKSDSFAPKVYLLSSVVEFPKNAYFLSLNWLSDERQSLNKLQEIYNIDFKQKIEINGYWMNVFSLSKKP